MEELGYVVMNNSFTVFCWVQKTVVSDRFITAPLFGWSQAQEAALRDPTWCRGRHEWNMRLFK